VAVAIVNRTMAARAFVVLLSSNKVTTMFAKVSLSDKLSDEPDQISSVAPLHRVCGNDGVYRDAIAILLCPPETRFADGVSVGADGAIVDLEEAWVSP
jgi:hypothetical protein